MDRKFKVDMKSLDSYKFENHLFKCGSSASYSSSNLLSDGILKLRNSLLRANQPSGLISTMTHGLK
jgi:hypothetical protein